MGPESNSNEGVLYNPESCRIGASASDAVLSCPGHVCMYVCVHVYVSLIKKYTPTILIIKHYFILIQRHQDFIISHGTLFYRNAYY